MKRRQDFELGEWPIRCPACDAERIEFADTSQAEEVTFEGSPCVTYYLGPITCKCQACGHVWVDADEPEPEDRRLAELGYPTLFDAVQVQP